MRCICMTGNRELYLRSSLPLWRELGCLTLCLNRRDQSMHESWESNLAYFNLSIFRLGKIQCSMFPVLLVLSGSG